MFTRTIASLSILAVSVGLFPGSPAKAEAPLNPGLCNRVYQEVASASANQSSKSQNISGGGSYTVFSVNGSSQYSRSSAASQSDLNRYHEMNCDRYIQAVYGVKLADIQARERMNANNNQTRLDVTRNTNQSNVQMNTSNNRTQVQMNTSNNRTQVQMNREDNVTKRYASKNDLFGSGIGAFAQLGAALINRPRNPEPAPTQAIASNPAPTQPVSNIEQTVQPSYPAPYAQAPTQVAYMPQPFPNPYAQAPTQVAYAPPTPSAPTVLFSSNPGIPVSPVIIAKVNAALSSQGLFPTVCTASPIVVLSLANGQYTACAQPSAAFPPGNYRLNIPGF